MLRWSRQWTATLSEPCTKACDPREALEVGDPRNVDLDQVGGAGPRGDDWAKKIARDYELSLEPVCKLFSGLPGSGKSTELRRLLHGLSKKGFLSVLIDAETEIDLASPIDAAEIVAVVVQEVERAVLRAEDKDPDLALQDGYGRRLWDFLANTEITADKVAVGLGPVKLPALLRTNPTVRARFRELLRPRLTEFLNQARVHAESLQVRARSLGHEGIVVALDSLEKLRGPTDSWEAVVDSAERVFSRGMPNVRLPLHTIYTVPTALLSRQLDIEFMPAVKVRSRDGREHKPGFDSLVELIRRRIDDEDRTTLFGSDGVQEELLARIVRDSGGYLRSIVQTLRAVVAADAHPISDEFLERVFQGRVDDYKRIVTKEDHEFLSAVAAEKEMILQDGRPETRRLAEHLLTNSVVLRYQNANDWFDLHPAVKLLPGLRDRLKTRGK